MGLYCKDMGYTDWKVLKILTGLEGHANAITAVALQNNIAITGSYDKTAKIWHVDTGAYTCTLAGYNRHSDAITSVALDGDDVVTGSRDCSAKIWDSSTVNFCFPLQVQTDMRVLSVQ